MKTNQQEKIHKYVETVAKGLIEQTPKYMGATFRGLIGQVPGVGPLAVELLNVTIPNQRLERIEKLLNILSQKTFNISEEELQSKFNSTDFIDIFEDVLRQSTRATSDIRLEYLASVLKSGIDSEKLDHLKKKRLLEILEKLNDIEIILLRSYSLRDNTYLYQDFINNHCDIFNTKEEQGKTKSSEIKDRQNFISHYEDNLISLGLVGVNQNNERLPILPSSPLTTELLPTCLGVNLLELIGFEKLELDSQYSEQIMRVAEPINALDVYRDLLETSESIPYLIKQNELFSRFDENRPY